MSSFALVASDPRYMVDSDGNVYGPKGQRKLSVDSNGYRSVNTTSGRFRVHRLVAEAFIPNPEEKPHAAHIDGDKSNNVVTNLYWATESENMLDKRKHGSNKGGVPRLGWDEVRQIRDYPCYRGSQQVLAAKFGVSQTLISMILNGKVWKEYYVAG